MILTDLSVKRPVLASVLSILLVVFGIVAFNKLALREYPNIDPPIISIETSYRGASASVVETRITQIIEDKVNGIEGIRYINSSSEDGRSIVTLEFNIERDIEAAANDVRDRISGILSDLPAESDAPEIKKVNSDDDVIIWLNLTSNEMNTLELTDYASRHIVDQFTGLNGVADVYLAGGKKYAMRIWLDHQALAARNLTVSDIENALRTENIELPAGSIESHDRHFTARVERSYKVASDFGNLPLARADKGEIIRLKDVAKVELGAEESRTSFFGNGEAMIGLGITKQSTANTLTVARGVNELVDVINPSLPSDLKIKRSFDSSVFIDASIKEVYQTLLIAMILVICIIFTFLGSIRAMLIPAITVPISLLGTFIVLYAMGYTVNLLTLLALILAIGMVVDDAIVMLENIYRKIEEGQPPAKAALYGAREVAFPIIVTTLVLIAVFMPITFLEGDLGQLFKEFAVAMSAAVLFSSFVALSLTPMMCSKILCLNEKKSKFSIKVDNVLKGVTLKYKVLLIKILRNPRYIIIVMVGAIIGTVQLIKVTPQEFSPSEDRGALYLIVDGPQGASFKYIDKYMAEIERRLMPLVEQGDIMRLLVRAPRSFDNTADFSNGMAVIVLEDWSNRRTASEIQNDIRDRLQDLAGVRTFPVMRQSFGRGVNKPVQFVLGGPNYKDLAEWRDILVTHASENKQLLGLDFDYKETKPQLRIHVNNARAADLGVSVQHIGETLETLLGSRKVTSFMQDGEEYDVIVEGDREHIDSQTDLNNIHVRSNYSGKLIPLSSLVTVDEFSDASKLNRFNRVRAITFEANLADGYSLGEAIDYLNAIVDEHLPEQAIVNYKGQSLDYIESGDSMIFVFILSLIIVFLVLAAQFESYIDPVVIMLTVPVVIFGAVLGLWLTGETINIYSQISMVMLIGLAAKNGILIVEMINQLRAKGINSCRAIVQGSANRLRPILMTAITTVMGAIPLIFASGAGSETRYVIGVVVVFGSVIATLLTIFIVPVAYSILSKNKSIININNKNDIHDLI